MPTVYTRNPWEFNLKHHSVSDMISTVSGKQFKKTVIQISEYKHKTLEFWNLQN